MDDTLWSQPPLWLYLLVALAVGAFLWYFFLALLRPLWRAFRGIELDNSFSLRVERGRTRRWRNAADDVAADNAALVRQLTAAQQAADIASERYARGVYDVDRLTGDVLRLQQANAALRVELAAQASPSGMVASPNAVAAHSGGAPDGASLIRRIFGFVIPSVMEREPDLIREAIDAHLAQSAQHRRRIALPFEEINVILESLSASETERFIESFGTFLARMKDPAAQAVVFGASLDMPARQEVLARLGLNQGLDRQFCHVVATLTGRYSYKELVLMHRKLRDCARLFTDGRRAQVSVASENAAKSVRATWDGVVGYPGVDVIVNPAMLGGLTLTSELTQIDLSLERLALRSDLEETKK